MANHSIAAAFDASVVDEAQHASTIDPQEELKSLVDHGKYVLACKTPLIVAITKACGSSARFVSSLALVPEFLFWILCWWQPSEANTTMYILTYSSSVSVMVMAASLMLHLGTPYLSLGIFLLTPILLVIFRIFMEGYRSGFGRGARDYQEDESELKFASDISSKATPVGCTVLAGIILGNAVTIVVKYIVCATFLAILFANFVMWLTTIKPPLGSRSSRKLLLSVLERLCYIVLGLQASTNVVPVAEVLGIYGVLFPFLIVIGRAAHWFKRRFINEETSTASQDNLRDLSLVIFYFLHAVTMVLYSQYVGGEAYSFLPSQITSMLLVSTTSLSTYVLMIVLLP